MVGAVNKIRFIGQALGIRVTTGDRRRGSTTVIALMVSMMLIILLLATMSLTMVDVELTQDFGRNKKTFQAAESGIAHSDIVLAHAVSTFDLPSSTTLADLDAYANDAEFAEDQRQLSLLLDAGEHFENDLYLTEGPDVAEYIEYESEGLQVGYETDIDVTAVGVDRPASGSAAYEHTFHYEYEISSHGQATLNSQQHQITRNERGSFSADVRRPSFATYGYFTESAKNQNNDQLWFYQGEVYDGPTHVNGIPPQGQTAFYGEMDFNGAFTAVQERYEDSLLAGGANPHFNAGATWGVEHIELPENGWSQLRASIGDEENVSNDVAPVGGWEDYLIDWMQLSDSPATLSQGVYYSPNYNEGSTLLGGIMVWGDTTSITMEAGGMGSQIVTITQNNDDGGTFDGSHTWVFRDTGSRTYVSIDGGAETMFNEPLNGLVHVEGSILSLGGEGTNLPDIEASHGITISGREDIYISDHITYENSPIDNLDAENILGIFSSNGNIMLDADAPVDLNLHATVMAASDYHGIGAEGILDVSGRPVYDYPDKGLWNLVGGLIEHTNQTTGVFFNGGERTTGYNWNFTYDDRFQEGKAPPYFPYVTRFIMTIQDLQVTDWGRKYYEY